MKQLVWPIGGWTVIYVVLAVAVPLWSLTHGAPLYWAATTLLFAVLLTHTVARVPRPVARMTLAGLGAAALLGANLLLASSYFIQGSGFNDAFYFHLHPDIVHAFPPFAGMLTAAGIQLVAGMGAAILAARWARPGGSLVVSITALLLAVACFTPIQQFGSDVLERATAEIEDPEVAAEVASMAAVQDEAVTPSQEPIKNNLVLIYLEGIDQAFFDEQKFPGLLPRLTRFQERGINFTQMAGIISGTIFGIVATQCGWPLFRDTFPSTADDEHLLPGVRCLGDELSDHGYTAIFMGGAQVEFGRKDKFFLTHGFSSVLGLRVLKRELSDWHYVHGWGLYDDSLFELAYERFLELGEQQPFFLTLLTVGTHYPGHVSKSCPQWTGSDDRLLQAVHCTDHVVAGLIDKIRGSDISDQTVIVVLSDHLFWATGPKMHNLGPSHGRHMTFVIDAPGQMQRTIDTRATQFDTAATVLSAMGLEVDGTFGLGSSLFAGDGYLWTHKSGVPREEHSLEAAKRGQDAILRFVQSEEVRSVLTRMQAEAALQTAPATPARGAESLSD